MENVKNDALRDVETMRKLAGNNGQRDIFPITKYNKQNFLIIDCQRT